MSGPLKGISHRHAVSVRNAGYAPCDVICIYLDHVKTLAEGHGLAQNGTAVDGFSSLLWIGLLSVLGVAGLPPRRCSVSPRGPALLYTYALSRGLLPDHHWALAPTPLLAATADPHGMQPFG